MIDPATAFDDAFHARAPRLRCRAELPGDRAFLIRQHIACSALAATLPAAMLAQQAEFQLAAHNHAHPAAMHRIATLDGEPVGRFMIDWTPDDGYGVDLAVLPEYRATGAGLHFLRAWTAACDATGRSASLEVVHDNPAARIYARLGFVPDDTGGAWSPMTRMIRPASARAPAAARE